MTTVCLPGSAGEIIYYIVIDVNNRRDEGPYETRKETNILR